MVSRSVLRFMLALLLASCTPAASNLPAPSVQPVAPSAAPFASPDQSASSPGAPGTPGEVVPLQALLPSEFDGVPAHTFATAPDLLVRLAALAGVDVADVEVAYASEHGVTFVQTYAIRIPELAPQELLELLPSAVYPGIAPPQVEVTQQTLAGRPVVVMHQASAASRIGTFWALATDDAIILVQGLDPAVAESAIRALP
jgi:hypothetical protein